MSASVTERTNKSGYARIALRISAGPFTFWPLAIVPEGSIAAPPSLVRNLPVASKFSMAKPMGSINRWQFAQTGFARWASMRSLMDRGLLGSTISFNGGTFAGIGGGGLSINVDRMNLPRTTGEVLFP